MQNCQGSSTPSWNSCDLHASSLWHVQSLVMSQVVSLFGELRTCYHLFEDFGQRKAEAFNLRSSQEVFKGNILSLAVCQVQGSLCITVGVGQIYSTNPEGLPEASRLAGMLFMFLWMFHSPARFTVSPSHLHIQKQISLPQMTMPERCRAIDMHRSVLTDTKCPPGAPRILWQRTELHLRIWIFCVKIHAGMAGVRMEPS